jgi:hypothetical protein
MSQPKFQGIDSVYKSKADNKDIRDLLEKLIPKAKGQMVEFSKRFKGQTDEQTCRNIFNYLINHFTYVADGEEQIIKLPSALLKKKVGDCKSFSLFTASILENLGIPYLMFSIANFLTTEASFDMIKNIGDIKGDLQKQKINKLEIEKLMNYSEESDSLEIIKKKINWDKFIWSSDFKIDNIGDGFTEYLINKGEPFKQTGNHPDETQHTNFFNDIIYPKFISEINSI